MARLIAKLAEVMKANDEMATGVFRQLSGLAKQDGYAEAKQEMKEKVKEKRKVGKKQASQEIKE
ncbi:hypothetical protein MMC28_009273 [Mycoblastus sanguinarius]|nr:hypothetical protein [Mycoblastus sanguinarius]